MSESRLRSEDMPPELTEWFDRLKHEHKITKRIEKEKAPKDGGFQNVYSAYCNDCGWSAPPDGFDVTWQLWSAHLNRFHSLTPAERTTLSDWVWENGCV